MNLMYKLERKFGHLAIKNLSLVIICCYGVGYLFQIFLPEVLYYLTLDPYAIVHGQVWRLLSWILIPPSSENILFLLLSLVFYYSIGTSLEYAWGRVQYNLYVFSGIIFTIIGNFLMLGYCYLFGGETFEVISSVEGGIEYYFRSLSFSFSTYYISMSLFLAYATTFPDNQVLLMFIIPIRVKWLGIFYGVYLSYIIVSGILSGGLGFVYLFTIGSSLLNFVIFFFSTRRYVMKNKAQKDYNKKINNIKKEQQKAASMGLVKHKCALCGKTEKDGEHLVFRYCSKCNGNFEFCQDHIYTHIHKE